MVLNGPHNTNCIRVHIQSSLGGDQFASRWIPADIIDTLKV